MDAKKFGTFIATLRKENNMTQVELAQKLQVTDAFLDEYNWRKTQKNTSDAD